MTRDVVVAALEECVHIIGARNFLAQAERFGLRGTCLGPAISVERFVAAVAERDPRIVGVGYRLSADACRTHLAALHAALDDAGLLAGRTFLFGGTAETAEVAREAGWFAASFDGCDDREQVLAVLRELAGKAARPEDEECAREGRLVERVAARGALPLVRHHVGLPTVSETVDAVRELASSGLIDVISIAPDQAAQEAFFAGVGEREAGAGGVAVRTPSDLERIYDASRRGNYPLCRCYSGTNDVLRWAEMLLETIRNAWCAVPLSWYNTMDRRGPRPLHRSIREAVDVMRWHAARGVPVEVNEPHQWSLRRASDATAVATAYLGALVAKHAGVAHYVSQIMLNTPAGIAPDKDLAKALAMTEIVEGLHDASFTSFRELRPGLLSYPPDPDAARGQLAFSTMCAMHLRPEIFHVVAFTEGTQAAGAEEILASVRLARRVMREVDAGYPSDAALRAPHVTEHKCWLLQEARAILDGVRALGGGEDDALHDPAVVVRAIGCGLLDAPDLVGGEGGRGEATTAIVDGACVSIDPATGGRLPEAERVRRILEAEGI
ncbi:MAG: methionine synthase [Candidatus Bipolaricaulota bacterium]|nr:MAG: methionine synthase [Candidatus Bipolaricaulota bacterium]